MIYVKKPIQIEAVIFNGSSTQKHDIENWMAGGAFPKDNTIHTRDIITFKISTSEGIMTASMGDYIIKEPFDKECGFYPCKPDIFKQTYYTLDEYNYEHQ